MFVKCLVYVLHIPLPPLSQEKKKKYNKYNNKHIALIGNNTYNWILTYFGIVLSGNVAVPIDKDYDLDLIESGYLDSFGLLNIIVNTKFIILLLNSFNSINLVCSSPERFNFKYFIS